MDDGKTGDEGREEEGESGRADDGEKGGSKKIMIDSLR